ncbi:hypothetical protein MMC32_000222 [Xylographa parallela]|nr:hypothetical protein [Xylographa parallela]
MHAAILLTLLHDRHLAAVAHTKLSTTEAFHYYQAIALFNSKLSGPLQGSEGDALWAASAILDAISFCHVEAKTPEEAWPLKPPSSLDLNWLSLSEGKLEVWRKTSPNRPDGIFRLLAFEYMNFPATISSRPRLEVLPLDLILLCGLDASSTATNNPYHAAALSIARSLVLTCDYTVNLSFTMFIMQMPSEYKHLLTRKDPRALLLLAYWYAKVCQYEHWWIVGRAALECQAICIYLERHHGDDANILRLLEFPKTIAACFARGNAVDYLTPYLIE